MAYRELELTLLSARDLKNVNLITRMEVYAVVTISGDPLTRQCTAPDPFGGRNPCWNATLRFSVPPTAAAAASGCLHVLLRAERVLGDRDVGEVIVPLAELLGGAATAGPQPPQLASYQVRKVHRLEPRGVLNVSYRLGTVVAPVEPAEKKPPPVVMAYPVAVGPPSTQPPHHPRADAYPPPPAPPRPAAAAVRAGEKHESSPAPAPPRRNGKGSGLGPAGPTQVCVGPHTQIFLGGGGGGPTGPAGAATTSPTGSNSSPRKPDGGWPTKQQDTQGGGGGAYYSSPAAQSMISPRNEDRSRPKAFSYHDTEAGFFHEAEATSHRSPATSSPRAPPSRRSPASTFSSRSNSSSSSAAAAYPSTLSPCSSAHSSASFSSSSAHHPSTPSPRPLAQPAANGVTRREAISSPQPSSSLVANHSSMVPSR